MGVSPHLRQPTEARSSSTSKCVLSAFTIVKLAQFLTAPSPAPGEAEEDFTPPRARGRALTRRPRRQGPNGASECWPPFREGSSRSCARAQCVRPASCLSLDRRALGWFRGARPSRSPGSPDCCRPSLTRVLGFLSLIRPGNRRPDAARPCVRLVVSASHLQWCSVVGGDARNGQIFLRKTHPQFALRNPKAPSRSG